MDGIEKLKLTNQNLVKENSQLKSEIAELRTKFKQAELISKISHEDNQMGTWEVDMLSGKQVWSKNYCKLLGYEEKLESPTENHFYSHVYKDDLELVKNTMQECIKTKSPCTLEFRYVDKNGSIKFCKSTANYLFDEDGNIVRIIGVFQDITKQKTAISQLADSEQKYKSLYENAPLSYQSLDINGNFIDVNPTWLSTLGYEREEVIGKNYGDFLHPDWKKHFEINFPAFKKRGYVNDVQFKIRHKKGHYLYISFEGCIGTHPDGSFKQTYCVFKDITEQKRYEKALEKNQFNLSLAQKIGKIGTWELDIVNNKLQWTKQNYDNFGLKHGTHLTYEVFLNCIHPDDRDYVRTEWKKALSGEPYDIEHKIVANGEVKWVREKADVKFDKDGNAISAIGLTQDITTFKESAQQITESELLLNEMGAMAKVGGWQIDLKTNKLTWTKEVYEIHEVEDDYMPTVDRAIDFYNDESKEIITTRLNETISNGTPFDATLGVITAKGNRIYVRALGKPIFNEEGEITTVFGSFQDVTEKVIKEQELEESNHKFKSLFDNVEEGIALHKMIFDENNNPIEFEWVDVNPKYEEITHLKKEKLIGNKGKDIIPSIEQSWYDLYERVVKTGIPETRIDHSEYLNKYWEVKAFRPEEAHFAVAMTDVTERILNEKKIIEEKTRAEQNKMLLEKIAENYPNSYISIIEKDLTVGFTSGQEFKKLNLNPDDFVGLTLEQVFGENANFIKQKYLETFNGKEQNFELFVDKQYQHYKTVPLSNEEGIITRILSVVENITYRKENELELLQAKELSEKNEKLYYSFIKNIGVGVVVHNSDTSIAFNNRQAEELLGLNKEQILGKKAVDPQWNFIYENNSIVPVEDYPVMQVLKSKKKLNNLIFGVSKPSGKIIWLNVNGFPLINSENEIVQIIISFVDVSKQKQSELILKEKNKELRLAKEVAEENEVKFKALYDFSPDMYVSVSPETSKIILCNETFLAKTGYSRNEIIGASIFKVYHSGSQEGAKQSFKEFKETGEVKNKELVLLKKDGESIDVSLNVTSIRDNNGKILYSMSSWRDITEKKKMENQARVLSRAMDQSPVSIVVTDIGGVIEYVNPAFTKISGYSTKDAIGSTPRILKSGKHPQNIYDELWKTISSGKIWAGELINKNKDGSYYWVNKTISPVFNSNNEIIQFVLVSEDITQKKTQEESLLRLTKFQTDAQQLAKVGYWVYNIEKNSFEAPDILHEIHDSYPNISIEELIKRIHPDDVANYMQQFNNLLAGEDSVSFNYRVLHSNGETKHIYTIGKSEKDEDGKVTKLIGSAQDVTKAKKAEETIAISENKFRTIIENAPVLIDSFDKNGKCILWNKECEKKFGWTIEELNAVDDSLRLFYPDDEDYNEVIDNVTSKPKKKFREWTPRTKYGYKISTLWADFEVLDGDVISIGIDVTENRNAEIALKNSETKLKEAQKVARLGNWEMTVETEWILWSDEVFSIFGIEKPSDNGITFTDFMRYVVPEDHAAITNLWNKLDSDGEAEFEYRITRSDGEIRWISGKGKTQFNKKGTAQRMYGVLQDVSEKKKQEIEIFAAKEQAEERETQLKNLTNNFVNGMIYQVVTLDENTRKFTYVSDNVKKLYGVTPEEVEENPNLIYGRIHKDDINGLIDKEKEAIKNNTTLQAVVRVMNIDGTVRWSNFVSQPRKINGVIYWDGLEYDITDSKKLELDLINAKEKAEESDRLKSAFLSNMSHEIRTPMNGILGFIELLQDPDLDRENQQQFMGIVQKSSERLLDTVNDIVEISKIESGSIDVNTTKIDLVEILDGFVEFFKPECKAKGLELKIENYEFYKQILFNTDITKFNSIISNLLKNAIKYTEKGYIKTGWRITRDEVIYYCSDSGMGIAKDRQKAIFNRFEQADIEDKDALQGSGLGLTIVKSYVEMLGGSIWVESEVGKGSTFYVSFPTEGQFINKVEESLNLDKNNEYSNFKYLNVLIVEDDETSLNFLSIVSKSLFGAVRIAKNGKEAVDLVKNDSSIDLVLMDLKMPIMNGYEATRNIRKFNKQITIIAQTAFGFEEDKQKSRDAGCDDFIAKPIKKTNLIEVIDRQIRLKKNL